MATSLPSPEAASRSLCIFFPMGQCHNGDSCSFSHSSGGGRQLAGPESVGSEQPNAELKSANGSVECDDSNESSNTSYETLSSPAMPVDRTLHHLPGEEDDSLVEYSEELGWPKNIQGEDQSEFSVYRGKVPTFQADDDSSKIHCRTLAAEEESGVEVAWDDNGCQESTAIDRHDTLASSPTIDPSSWAEDVAVTHQSPWAPEEIGDSDIPPDYSGHPAVAELEHIYPPSLEDTPARSSVDLLNPGRLSPVAPDEADFYEKKNAPVDAYDSHLDPSSQSVVDPPNPEFSQPVTLDEAGVYIPDVAPVGAYNAHLDYPVSQPVTLHEAGVSIPDVAPVDAYDVHLDHPLSHDDRQKEEASLAGGEFLHWSEYADPYANIMVPFCKFFAQARCEQGAACRFRHSLTVKEYAILFRDPQPPLWSPNGHIYQDESTNPAPTSFGVCKFYPLGKCRNGTSCPYLHTPSDGAQPHDPTYQNDEHIEPMLYLENHVEPTLNPSERRIQPCKYFVELGRCRRLDQCYYSHDITPYQDPAASSSGDGARRKTSYDLCKYYLQGTCQFGTKCRFLHELPPEEEAKVESNALPQDTPSGNDDDGWGAYAEGWGVDEWAKPQESTTGDKELVAVEESRWGNLESSLPADRQWPPDDSEYDPWTQPKSTRCMYHFRGRCKKGDRCNLDHDGPKSAILPSAGTSNGTRSRSPAGGHFKHPASLGGQTSSSAGLSNVTPSGSPALGTRARSATPTGVTTEEDDFRRTWGAVEGTDEKLERQPAALDDGGWGDSESEKEFSPWTAPKKPICHFYVEGCCKKGRLCQLRHEIPETKEVPIISDQSVGDRNSEADGILNRVDDELHLATTDDMGDIDRPTVESNGDSSPGYHDEDEKTWNVEWPDPSDECFPPPKSQAPCKAFGQGHCPFGDSCRYEHIVDVDAMVEVPPRHQSPIKPSDAGRSDETEVPGMQEALMNDAPDAKVDVFEQELFNCTVRFDNSCAPMHISTASESCRIIVTNLPPTISELEAIELAETIDDLEFGHESIETMDVSEAGANLLIKFVTPQDAVKAITKLHGQTYDSRPLTARLVTENVMTPLDCTTIKVTWPAPSLSAWVYYSSITTAKAQEKRLEGYPFQGRKLKASFSRPRPQDKAFAVKISNFLVDTDKAAIEELSQASTIHRNAPTYEGCPLDAIRDTLAARGSLQDFHRVPIDPARARHVAFARFDGGLDHVLEAHGVVQPFLGKGSLSLQKVFYANYHISARRYQAVRGVLEKIHETLQDTCSIRVFDTGEPVDIHLDADAENGAAFGTANSEVQEALRGQIMMNGAEGNIPLWDEYFDLPSSARAVEHINKDTSYFIKLDSRRRLFRVLGDRDSRARAQGIIMKLLKKVRAHRHIVPLDLRELRFLVDGGYVTLQGSLGEQKVMLDVTVPELVVRGDDADLQKAKTALAAAASSTHNNAESHFHTNLPNGGGDGMVGDSDTVVTCPICRRAPRTPITLTCGHVYCTSCLQHLLHKSAGLHFVPPRCIGDSSSSSSSLSSPSEHLNSGCGEHGHIPYNLIQDLLPTGTEAALLRGAFLAHVRARPEEFFFCPTPHCETVYRVVAEDRSSGHGGGQEVYVYMCPTCRTKVCGGCRWEYHEGVECPAGLVS